jgi:putative tryptophan/tyrosine transport system substrate-binding protein
VKRREFITLLGGTAAAWPLMARAQQTKLPTIGVLVLGSPRPEAFLKGLRDALRDVGYIDGRNIRLEIRNSDGKDDLLTERAADLVRLRVDIIVTFQTPAATAAKEATGEIPIVMALVGDPVGAGLVASYAKPGANVTGTAAGSTEAAGKTVELIREVFPSARRFAVLANETDPFTKPFLAAIGLGADRAGMEMETVMARPGLPLDEAFESIAAKRVNAVVIQGSMVRKEAIELTMKHRLPAFGISSELPATGGLMSYSANLVELYRDTAVYIDKILKGAKPSDLPVNFPTKFELVINLKAAKVLGLVVPPTLLARADEVIE